MTIHTNNLFDPALFTSMEISSPIVVMEERHDLLLAASYHSTRSAKRVSGGGGGECNFEFAHELLQPTHPALAHHQHHCHLIEDFLATRGISNYDQVKMDMALGALELLRPTGEKEDEDYLAAVFGNNNNNHASWDRHHHHHHHRDDVAPASTCATSPLTVLSPSLSASSSSMEPFLSLNDAGDIQFEIEKLLAAPAEEDDAPARTAATHHKKTAQKQRSSCEGVTKAKVSEAVAAPDASTSTTTTIAGIPASQVDASRKWVTVFRDEKVVRNNGAADPVQVTVKTRRDKPSELLPDRLFSSLKYEITSRISQDMLLVDSVPFLHCCCIVVESDSFAKVEKNERIKSVLKGTVEAAMTKSATSGDPNVLQGTLKVQLDNHLSFHMENKQYCWEVHYFLPNALDTPVLIRRSPAFRAYARRPNKPRKRKSLSSSSSLSSLVDEDEEDNEDTSSVAAACDDRHDCTQQPEAKRHKSEEDNAADPDAISMTVFMQKLTSLVETKNKLNAEDRKRAMDLVFSHFMDLDDAGLFSALPPLADNNTDSNHYFVV